MIASLALLAQDALVVRAEPPPFQPPEPVFPIVPLYTGVAAAGMIFAGVSLHVYGADAQSRAQSLSDELLMKGAALEIDALELLQQDLEQLEAVADQRQLAGTLFLVGGVLALSTSILIYVALEPEGGWSWSLTGDASSEALGLRVARAF